MFRSVAGLAALLFALAWPVAADAACARGAFGPGNGDFVVVAPVPSVPPPGRRYLFRDGRRGDTAAADSPIRCAGDIATVRIGAADRSWRRIPFSETEARFTSAGTELAGWLLEPAGARDPRRPLVVMVHGSERTPAIGDVYAYALAAQGIAVFAYDKRGTGASQGEYTQNFELLAADAAAALAQARKMAAGRFGRAGYFGGSQGGWVAPLAATRAPADFVAIGFGLVASPIDEDRDQMLAEARAAGLGEAVIPQIERLSAATGRLLSSHFEHGYDQFAEVQRALAGQDWTAHIRGEHSGTMLRTDVDDLRRIGRARFDNLELIWEYDSVAALERLNAPLLWVLAGEDREAPIAQTRASLRRLIAAGKAIDLYLFPRTDHGMFEFTTAPDGSRKVTRITDGYLRLLGDWIKGTVSGRYGHAQRLD